MNRANKRPGVDAGWLVQFAFLHSRPRATQARRTLRMSLALLSASEHPCTGRRAYSACDGRHHAPRPSVAVQYGLRGPLCCRSHDPQPIAHFRRFERTRNLVVRYARSSGISPWLRDLLWLGNTHRGQYGRRHSLGLEGKANRHWPALWSSLRHDCSTVRHLVDSRFSGHTPAWGKRVGGYLATFAPYWLLLVRPFPGNETAEAAALLIYGQ